MYRDSDIYNMIYINKKDKENEYNIQNEIREFVFEKNYLLCDYYTNLFDQIEYKKEPTNSETMNCALEKALEQNKKKYF